MIHIRGSLHSQSERTLTQAHVHMGIQGDRHHKFLLSLGTGLDFDFEWDLPGAWELRFSALGHWEKTVSLNEINNGKPMKIILQRVTYPPNPDFVCVFGSFNNWDLNNPLHLSQNSRGVWRAKVQLDLKEFTYKFMNLLTPTESATDLSASNFAYDGHGSYNSIGYVTDGEFEFIYDPSQQNSQEILQKSQSRS